MSVNRRSLVALSVAAAIGATATPSFAADAKAGRALAETWCASCHVIGPGSQSGATDSAPTFVSIANRQGMTEAGVQTFLADPHKEAMKGIVLPRLEIADLAAYIASLKEPEK